MLGWLRVLHADAALSMLIYTGATIAFYILGAAVLHGQGLQVTDRELIETLGQMYRQTLGATGAWIFLIGAFAVLYSTFFVATASNARLFADAAAIFGARALPRRGGAAARRARGMRRSADRVRHGVLPVSAARHPRAIGAIGQALMLPFLGAAALYFHHRRLAGVIHSSALVDVRPLAVGPRDDARRRIPAGADPPSTAVAVRALLSVGRGEATFARGDGGRSCICVRRWAQGIRGSGADHEGQRHRLLPWRQNCIGSQGQDGHRRGGSGRAAHGFRDSPPGDQRRDSPRRGVHHSRHRRGHRRAPHRHPYPELR